MKKNAYLVTEPLNLVALLGASTINLLAFIGEYTIFAGKVLHRALTPPWRIRMVLEQCMMVGIKSFPIAALTSMFIGMVMVLQTGVQLAKFGSKTYVPGISFIANAREMVPAFCAIVVGARVAASITAELGTMRVTEQLDAMDLLNVDPVRYLCAPRVLALTFMLPMISCLCLVTGYYGGMLVADRALGIDTLAYYTTTVAFAKIPDIVGGLIKTFVFGLLVSLTGCYYGFNTHGGAAGVGRATTNSVVLSLVLILTFDYLLTAVILRTMGVD